MEQQNQSILTHQLDQESTGYLMEAAKWARFMAIVGFVFCGLMVVFALFAGTIMATYMNTLGSPGGGIGGGVFTVVYLIFAVLWFFPCLYLFRFASMMQVGLRNNELEKVNPSFRNLKAYFKFIGIFIIVMLIFYALAIIGVIFAGVMAA